VASRHARRTSRARKGASNASVPLPSPIRSFAATATTWDHYAVLQLSCQVFAAKARRGGSIFSSKQLQRCDLWPMDSPCGHPSNQSRINALPRHRHCDVEFLDGKTEHGNGADHQPSMSKQFGDNLGGGAQFSRSSHLREFRRKKAGSHPWPPLNGHGLCDILEDSGGEFTYTR